jgi:hypothetical protein
MWLALCYLVMAWMSYIKTCVAEFLVIFYVMVVVGNLPSCIEAL